MSEHKAVWRELIEEVDFAANELGEVPQYLFAEPADEQAIREVEAAIRTPLHPDLRSFLSEANGLTVDFGNGFRCEFFFGTDSIVERNRLLRSSDYAGYMPLDHLIAFADPWNGDLFAYGLASSGKYVQGIFLWDHETDCRVKHFTDLEEFIRKFNKPWA